MLMPFATTRFLRPKERHPGGPRCWHFIAPHVRSVGLTRPVRQAHGTSKMTQSGQTLVLIGVGLDSDWHAKILMQQIEKNSISLR